MNKKVIGANPGFIAGALWGLTFALISQTLPFGVLGRWEFNVASTIFALLFGGMIGAFVGVLFSRIEGSLPLGSSIRKAMILWPAMMYAFVVAGGCMLVELLTELTCDPLLPFKDFEGLTRFATTLSTLMVFGWFFGRMYSRRV